ncbi:MAG TPA: caspase family protein, partial [Pyrinomonadaceae bacterium]|nr:caspase family protein [Pyrinomonadaceae bacterium]
LIGIGDYISNSVKDLNGCENDVAEMKRLLVEQYKFTDTPDTMRVLLSSNTSPAAKPTRANIIAAVNSFLVEKARQNPGAIVVFYYSGHGSLAEDIDGGAANPALKKDEGDGVDETLVASDSRDSFRTTAAGLKVKTFTGTGDIVDDEIDGWFGALSQSTNNITFIMDSCHSGTVTRNIGTPRRVEPAPGREPQTAAVSRNTSGERNFGGGGAPVLRAGAARVQNYAAISGCAPEQLSYETSVAAENGRTRVQGVMTASLVQMLRVKPASTYRELRDKLPIAAERMNYSHQTPQVEGDLDRFVFGGADERARPYARVTGVAGDSVTVNIGSVHGVQKDAFISLYKPEATTLQGAEGRVAVAQVVTANPFSSVAKITESSGSVTNESKVVLATPYFAGGKLVVALETSTGARAAAPASALASAVRQRADAKLVEFASVAGRFDGAGDANAWDVTLVQDSYSKFLEDRKKSATREAAEPGMNDPVVYIVSRSGQPLFDFWVRPADPDAAAKIASALEKRARQLGVKGLRNDATPFNSQLKVALFCVKTDAAGNVVERVAENDVDARGAPCDLDFNAGDEFVLEFKNESSKNLFLAVLSLGTSGNIGQPWPAVGQEFKLEAGKSVTSDPLQVGPPAGVETLKVLATTSYVDFSSLLQTGAMRGEGTRGAESPFGRLFDMAANKTRDTVARPRPGLEEWATKDVDFIIRAK